VIDLHIHTSASDGSYAPRRIVELARSNGLQCIAITDHDTVDGNAEAVEAGAAVGLEVIPGVEISVEWDNRPVHMLGYFIDWKNGELVSALQNLVCYREERNPKIIEKLNRLGMRISYEEVKKVAGTGTVGRPHVAQVLVEKGYVKNGDDAFQKYLQRGAEAYVEKKRLSPRQGIDLIKKAGGIAVLAHPFTIDGLPARHMEKIIVQFKDEGVEGLEVFYPMHSPEETDYLQTMARQYKLLQTGGSDFHGDQKPKILLGRGFGNLKIPYRLVEEMKKVLENRG